MPLASSRTASQKRAKVLAEKKEQEKRRERRLSTRRQSLPSSCRSTTVVNEAKARRRMSMRQKSDSSLQRKENEAPEDGAETGKTEVKGNMLPPSSSRATPYFVVSQIFRSCEQAESSSINRTNHYLSCLPRSPKNVGCRLRRRGLRKRRRDPILPCSFRRRIKKPTSDVRNNVLKRKRKNSKYKK